MQARQTWSFGKAIGNSSWYLSEKLLRLLGAFLVSAWVARYLGPHQFGTLAFAIGLVAMLGFLGSLGLESVVVRDLVQHPERESRIASSYFSLRLAGAALVPLIACGYVAVAHPGDRELLVVVGILASGVLLTSFDVVECVLQARHEARSASLVRAGALSRRVCGVARAGLVPDRLCGVRSRQPVLLDHIRVCSIGRARRQSRNLQANGRDGAPASLRD